MHKIAFLFLTIDNPHFPKLWDSYFRGNKEKYTLYVHPKNREKVTWKPKNIIKNLQETEWGFIVHAYIELFRAAYQDPENQKFVTISESDVPIQRFSKFYDDCMSDGRSWIKFKKIKNYNWKERINKQPKKDRPKHFIKHLARFCLNREHVKQLLERNKEQQLEFFYNMHVGDEFFLSVLYPIHNVKNFAVTYDDWNYVNLELQKIKEKKKQLYELQEKNGKNYSQSLKELQNNYNQIAKNPKSITNVRNDLQFIKQCPSYFYRKFTKKSNISDYWKEIIQAHN